MLLALETSCDDTAAAVMDAEGRLLAQRVSSQKEHAQWGGVIPELASRRHLLNLSPVVEHTLREAGVNWGDITTVACTARPGLIGSLLVGHSFARAVAVARGYQFIEVDHMQGHLASLFVRGMDEAAPQPRFPLLVLTVSGGHTQLTLMKSPTEQQILGQTLDDAAGEAFDKAAKLLGFEYPGGPLLDKAAEGGNEHFLHLPEPRISGYDFSFSGLKTALLYKLQAEQARNPTFVADNLKDIAASVQHVIVQALLDKLFLAAHELNISELGIVGGVSANRLLRRRFQELCSELDYTGHIPPFRYCTDNAAMIAQAAYWKMQQGEYSHLTAVPSPTI